MIQEGITIRVQRQASGIRWTIRNLTSQTISLTHVGPDSIEITWTDT